MSTATRYVVRSPAVVHETIDGEAVIINLESGAYFSAEGASATAWQTIAGGASAADLVAAVGERYQGGEAEIATAVAQFIAQLNQEGLIRPAEPTDGAPVASPSPPPAAKPAFTELSLRIFTDLQELLLLDPIHDVDEVGWPAPLPPR
jgi:coenzyme PQQ synthesis protein D (PqqD)